MGLLNTSNLCVAYGESNILRNVNIEIILGEITAIMGRNGAGKTTLLKTIIGLLKSQSGKIVFDGKEITNWKPDKRVRSGIAYVPQGREIFPRLTVEENLRLGLEARSTKEKKMDEDYIYDLFPILATMSKRLGGNLSGGQQQQLAIGRALVGQPKLLILDEPTEGIQPSIILEIQKTLLKLKEKGGLTIVLVEQYFDFAWAIANHIYVMENGTIPLFGAHESLRADQVKKYLAF